jgi:hypothetical protein
MHHHQQRLEDPPTSSLLVFLDGGGYCKKKSPPAAPPLLIYSYKKGASLGPLYTWECGGVCPAVDQLKKKRKKNSRDRMAQQRKTSLSLLGSDGSGHFLLYTQLWIGKRMQTNKSRSSRSSWPRKEWRRCAAAVTVACGFRFLVIIKRISEYIAHGCVTWLISVTIICVIL